jgi:hypothetical protein
MSSANFEIVYRDRLWRITLSEYGGEQRLSIWSHYRDPQSGDWLPCGGKRREAPGCIVPADRVDELAEAVCSMAQRLRSANGAIS